MSVCVIVDRKDRNDAKISPRLSEETDLNIILCGYHWTGCDALRRLLKAKHNVFVFTHESPSHIPSLVDYCVNTQTAYSLANISKSELPFQPDCIASIYYRHIIKQAVIGACDGRIFNLHPSLLPAYRGCSSLTWAMVNQQSEAGFTYHYIDEGCDTGNILLQQKMEIMPFDTQATLYLRVSTQAMEYFDEVLDLVAHKEPGRVQTGEPTYFPRGCPHNGVIDPDWSDEKIATFIRAMIHPPYPPATYLGREIYTFAEFQKLRQEAGLVQ